MRIKSKSKISEKVLVAGSPISDIGTDLSHEELATLTAMLPILQNKLTVLAQRGLDVVEGMVKSTYEGPTTKFIAMPPCSLEDERINEYRSSIVRRDNDGTRILIYVSCNFIIILETGKPMSNAVAEFTIGAGAHEYLHLLIDDIRHDISGLNEKFGGRYSSAIEILADLFKVKPEKLDLSLRENDCNEILAIFFGLQNVSDYLDKHNRLLKTDEGDYLHLFLRDKLNIGYGSFERVHSVLHEMSDKDLLVSIANYVLNQEAVATLPRSQRKKARSFDDVPDEVFELLKSKSSSEGAIGINTLLNALKDVVPDKGACFIATAVFEGEEKQEVQTFRAFRDQYLLKSYLGQKFISYYYRVGPGCAAFVQRHELFRLFIKNFILVPMNYLLLKFMLK